MFPQEYINRGQCTFTHCSVTLWSGMYQNKNICNVPCGRIQNAYWQGNTVHVIMEDGWHYVYEDFNSYSYRWKQ